MVRNSKARDNHAVLSSDDYNFNAGKRSGRLVLTGIGSGRNIFNRPFKIMNTCCQETFEKLCYAVSHQIKNDDGTIFI